MISKIIPLSQIADLIAIEPRPILHSLIKNFDVDFYKNFEHFGGKSDLAHMTNEEALIHFLRRGKLEGRVYNKWLYSFIDPEFYTKRYPELKLKTVQDIVRHWMYIGAFQKLIPNQQTQDLIDADIHLFNMGKVGSKSIEASLEKAGYKKLIPHLHWPDHLAFSYQHSIYDYAEIINYDTSKPRTFISGVRDPVERVISGYFQASGKSQSQNNILYEVIQQKLASDISKITGWFDHGYFSNIDIYDYPSDKKSGYSIIKKNNITIFLYRLDCIKKCWKPLSALTGLNLGQKFENISTSKEYAQKLQSLLANKKLTESLREISTDSKFMKHFFPKTFSGSGVTLQKSNFIKAKEYHKQLSKYENPSTSKIFLRREGLCPICEKERVFVARESWLRDHYFCEGCGSIPRERAIMNVIQTNYPKWRDLHIHESSPGNRGASVKMREQCKKYIATQYDLEVKFGNTHPTNGYRSEDLEKQTFDDNLFDLVVTQDVMEHVFNPENVFREIHRTLKNGGAHIFTTPIIRKESPSLRRAEMLADSSIRHIYPPEYHGNPLSKEGSLVTWHWGNDIKQIAANATRAKVEIVACQNVKMGIEGEYLEVIIQKKSRGKKYGCI